MSTLKLATVAALTVLLANPLSAAEPATPEADQYLQQYGLAEIHAKYAKFFTLLSDGKAVDANQLLAETLPEGVNPVVRDQVLRATAGLSTIFERGVEDAELIGLQKISNKSIALYYVLNSRSGPVLVILMPFRQRDSWRTHTWMMETNAPKIIEALKGIGRFPVPAVISFKPRGITA
ncbi:MAG TPA: hypothetical protein PLF81_21950 [Candidatus Anammoximicrobium sp.]|nr:hypothetical protein [Candidatus Anammoximicrobium sp.]